MNTALLKKIKKNWTIVQYAENRSNSSSPLMVPIYRALYKGKMVSYAWVEDKGQKEYRQLILAIAYGVSWSDWKYRLERLRRARINKKLGGNEQERMIKKAKQVWP